MAVSTEDARSHEFANSVSDRDSVFFKFDDAEFARSHRRVCAVALYGGRVLDGFQFFYDDQVPGYHRGGTAGAAPSSPWPLGRSSPKSAAPPAPILSPRPTPPWASSHW